MPQCEYCTETTKFKTKTQLNGHLETSHAEMQPFICLQENCTERFGSNYLLDMHERRSHSTCPHCNKRCTSPSGVKKHLHCCRNKPVPPGPLANFLSCPICVDDYRHKRIYQCQRGHAFCSDCWERLKGRRCPECRIRLNRKIRCLQLEKILSGN